MASYDDWKMTPPSPSDLEDRIWDMNINEVVELLIDFGVPLEDELRERLLNVLENEDIDA